MKLYQAEMTLNRRIPIEKLEDAIRFKIIDQCKCSTVYVIFNYFSVVSQQFNKGRSTKSLFKYM